MDSIVPIVSECSREESVVVGLRFGDGYAVHADFEYDDALPAGPFVAGIGPYARTWHPEQGRVASGTRRDIQDAIDTASGTVVLERYMIRQYLGIRPFGEQGELRFERCLARFVGSLFPETVEVFGTLCHGTYAFGAYSYAAPSLIVASADVCRGLQFVESRLFHLGFHGRRTLGKGCFADFVGIPFRTALQCYLGIGEGNSGLCDADVEEDVLSGLVCPIRMVGSDAYGNVVPDNLCFGSQTCGDEGCHQY